MWYVICCVTHTCIHTHTQLNASANKARFVVPFENAHKGMVGTLLVVVRSGWGGSMGTKFWFPTSSVVVKSGLGGDMSTKFQFHKLGVATTSITSPWLVNSQVVSSEETFTINRNLMSVSTNLSWLNYLQVWVRNKALWSSIERTEKEIVHFPSSNFKWSWDIYITYIHTHTHTHTQNYFMAGSTQTHLHSYWGGNWSNNG